MRWMVGLDYPNYYDFILGYVSEFELLRMEPIPNVTASIIRANNIPFYFWFITMAGLQFSFLLRTFDENKKHLIAWGIFFFLSDYLAFSLNCVRQAVALTIVLYSYQYIVQKSIWKYIICIVLASLFHKSALMCIPLYYINRYNHVPPIKIQFILFFLFLLFGNKILSIVLSTLDGISDMIIYSAQIERIKSNELQIKEGSGLGVIFHCFKYIILILYSKIFYNKYAKIGFPIFYNTMFIGICLYVTAMYDMYLSRFTLYFRICDIFILSFFFFDSLKKSMVGTLRFGIAVLLLCMQILIILHTVLSGEEWKFVWDVGKL